MIAQTRRALPVYLDHNATSPIRPEAAAAVMQALEIGGNASSVHGQGRAARALVEDGRSEVVRLVGGDPARLIFTSGGTEANALAIHGAVASGQVRRILVGAIEHDAVVQNARASGLPIEIWPVDGQGVADLGWLAERLARWTAVDGRPFACLMLANNETGVIQPVIEAAEMIRAQDGWLHVDAVQAAGKIAVDLAALGADTLALSAHKLGGPQGVGALAYGPRALISPLLHGGGQERGLRAGTENVAGIAGFAAAASAALDGLSAAGEKAMSRDLAANRLKRAGATVVGEGAPRLPNTLCVASPGWASALQVMALDLDGIMVSAGAACSSGKVKPSGVLTAMGLEPLAGCVIRASGGWTTKVQDWDRFADVWLGLHARQAARAGVREFA